MDTRLEMRSSDGRRWGDGLVSSFTSYLILILTSVDVIGGFNHEEVIFFTYNTVYKSVLGMPGVQDGGRQGWIGLLGVAT